MPWEVTIGREDQNSLGELEAVQKAIESAIPGVEFYREPSGLEKMTASGIEFPEVLRSFLETAPATVQADFEGDGFSMRLYLGTGPVVQNIGLEVRGSGDPMPCLQKLTSETGWRIIN